MSSTLPTPPVELAARIGGSYEQYHSIGALQRTLMDGLLPADWSYEGKTVLDFGCGPGRTLAAFATDAQIAHFVGCDIHAESIEWGQREMSPPYEFFLCRETPPLAQPDGRFDLVYAMSVFTHLTWEWAAWLTELHRVMAPGGLAVISVLGPAMAQQILGRDWDPRIGFSIVDMHKDWSIGGPSVLISEWWLREHWGRAFEVLSFQPTQLGGEPGHDLVLLRRGRQCSPELLTRHDPGDEREIAALECNIEQLMRQQEQLGDQVRELSGLLAARREPSIRRGLGLWRGRRDV